MAWPTPAKMTLCKAAGLVLAFVLAASAASAEARAAPRPTGRAASPAYALANTEQFALTSAGGRRFQISVARPDGPAPKEGFPVIYVLDPASAFATLVDTVRNQEIFFGPVVVVGIGYDRDADGDRRLLDLTPTTDRATLPKEHLGQPWGAVGGADAFLEFIQGRVKRVIERKLRIDRHRQALFGHSLGGLFVLHTLFTRPETFQTYVAGSPSIWWGQKSVLAEATAFKAGHGALDRPRRLLMTIGGWESEVKPEELAGLAKLAKPDDLERVRQQYREQIAAFAPVENCREMFTLLGNADMRDLQVDFVEFPHETHNSVIPAYLSRGAYFTLVPTSMGH